MALVVGGVHVPSIPAGGEEGLSPHATAGLRELGGLGAWVQAGVGDGAVLLVVAIEVAAERISDNHAQVGGRSPGNGGAVRCVSIWAR